LLTLGCVAALLAAGCATSPEEDLEDASEALSASAGEPTAAAIMAKLQTCRKASRSAYKSDASSSTANLHVCQLNNAVFFHADMDIDCDGKPSAACNTSTDPWFQPETAGVDSTGKPLDAAKLPFIVVPGVSSRWSYRAAGIRMGSVGVVIYQGRMEYGIVGDVGPQAILGEASYAMAERLGINPNPSTGGTASGVSYVIFTGSSGEVSINEDHEEAVIVGRARAAQLLREN
jgi:hypothetical protein